MTVNSIICVIKKAAVAWVNDSAPTYGAALAFYAAFSCAPLLIIAIAVASVVVGEDAARSGIVTEIHKLLGPVTASAVSSALTNASDSGGNATVTVLGVVTLILGASGVFGQLQDALNVIWKLQKQTSAANPIVHFFKSRILSFAAVVGTGFLLLISLIVNAVLAAMNHWLESVPGSTLLWQCVGAAASFACVALLFALIFKLLPDATVAWGDVWIGAILTAVLFTLGQQLITLYIGQAAIGSTHGAAGSLVALLVWVYYSAQIVLFGAEFTHAFAQLQGSQCDSKRQKNIESNLQLASMR